MDILVKCQVDQVTCHLREDRRHIQDDDLLRLLADGRLPVNLEMAATPEMLAIALRYKPKTVTLVPEKREEITTEGGLDLNNPIIDLSELRSQGIKLSFFIDPEIVQIDKASSLGAHAIELHTGTYCEAFGTEEEEAQWLRLKIAGAYAKSKKLAVFAGHGLNCQNLPRVREIEEIEEYNIGHSIIGRSVFVGLEKAILEIKALL